MILKRARVLIRHAKIYNELVELRENGMNSLEFPSHFRWGVSASGFQFEMGDPYRRYIDTNTDWWHWVRDPSNVSNRLVSGDLPEDGIDYFELYSRDHELARSLGMNIYRIGIEWSRIFPYPTWFVEVSTETDGYGYVKEVKLDEEVLLQLDKIANKEAVKHYREIITDLRGKGFKVIVNLMHFTIPYWLHNPIAARASNLSEGPLGLLEPGFPVEFAKFAAYVAWKLGDLVDKWSTMNEPMVPIELGYMGPYSGFPPGVYRPDVAPKALLNSALAHCLAYKAIKKFDRWKADADSSSEAEVGIIHNIIPAYGIDNSESLKAVEHYNYFHNLLILEAITRGRIDVGFNEKDVVRPAALGNALDWMGLNYYTRLVLKRDVERFKEQPILDFEAIPGYGYACVSYGVSKIGRWCDGMGWEMFPEGILDALRIASRFSGEIYITENGLSDPRDLHRSHYIVSHLFYILKAIEEGVRGIRGYMYWALTDNYEWAKGFRQKFGLYEVDLITKERVPRPTVRVIKDIITSNSITANYRRFIVSSEGLL